MKKLEIKYLDPIQTNEKGHQRYVFERCGHFSNEIHLVPWYKESWGTVNYFIAFQVANALGFKVVAYGNKNLLPFLSLISHEAVVAKYEETSEGLECANPFNLRSDINNFPVGRYDEVEFCFNENLTPHIVSIISEEFKRRFIKYMNEEYCQSGAKITNKALSVLRQKKLLPKDFYKMDKICLDSRVQQIFEKIRLDYPDNAVWCEIKDGWYEGAEDIILKYPPKGLLPDTLAKKPFEKKTQKELFQKYADYYMSVQILLSVHKGVKYIGIGGSANIFSVVPVNSLFLLSKEAYFNAAVPYKQKFEKEYYGSSFDCVFTPAIRYLNLKHDDSERCIKCLNKVESIFKNASEYKPQKQE